MGLRVAAPAGEQLGMGPRLEDPSGFEDQDPVGATDRGDLVRNDHAGSTGEVSIECLLDSGLGLGIEGAGAVVQQEHGRPSDDREGQGKPLPLATG